MISQAPTNNDSALGKPGWGANSGPGDPTEPDRVAPPANRFGPLQRTTALLIGAGCLPLLLAFFWGLWSKPAYRFFPLALLGGLWLWRRAWRTLPEDLEAGSGAVVGGLLGTSLCALVFSTVFWTPWGGAVAALLALAGLIWWLGGRALFRALLPGFLMLAITIPPPLGWDVRWLNWLGLKLVKAVSRMLYEMNVPHYLTSTAIELPGMRLALADVGALVNVSLGVAAFCLFYMLWRRRKVVPIGLGLCGSAGFTVLAVSTAMVVGVRMSAADRFDVFLGVRGAALEAAIAVVCVGLILSFDEFLSFLFVPVARFREGGENPAVREVAGPKMFALGVRPKAASVLGVTFAVLGLVQVALGGLYYYRMQQLDRPLVSRLAPEIRLTLTEEVGAWKQVTSLPIFLPEQMTNAAQRQVWYFEQADLAAAVSLEYPLLGFPDAAADYLEAGWTIWRRTPREATGQNGLPGWQIDMQRNWVQDGVLWAGYLDETGRWLPAGREVPALFERFKPRTMPPVTARVRVLVCGKEALAPEDRLKLEQLSQAVGQELEAQLKTQWGGK